MRFVGLVAFSLMFGFCATSFAQSTDARTARMGVGRASGESHKIDGRTMGPRRKLASQRLVGRRIVRSGATVDRRAQRILEARRQRRRQAAPRREQPASQPAGGFRKRWRRL